MNTPADQSASAAIAAATLELGAYQPAVDQQLGDYNEQNFTARFWQQDATLWTADADAQHSIRSFMGWLRVAETLRAAVPEIEEFVEEVKAAGFRHVVVMGMGGSTMAPIVFRAAFQQGGNGLPMSVLDTTDPGTVRQLEESLPLAETLFIVASKSGTTAEPLAFGDYFFDRVKQIKGERAGENFVAITDPGSKFVAAATAQGYRRIFLNFAEVGGRFSALSYFGMVPAALYGIDIAALLDRALAMMQACGADGNRTVPGNPGLTLGVALGVLAQQGRDKLTLITPPELADLGLWLEQLIAESTGKEGKGILPVAGEPLHGPEVYSADRVFVYVGYQGQQAVDTTAQLAALAQAGHPIIRIQLSEALDLGAEFFRWEVATAVASAVLRLNPFDQPNVQSAKTATDRLMKEVEAQGQLPAGGASALTENGVAYYADQQLSGADAKTLLAAFFGLAGPGAFLNLQAYLTESAALNQTLDQLREQVLTRYRLATTSGYGPRFLHSTGQYHKGGPNTGLFVQLTADIVEDVPLPGRSYTFGTFLHAQAAGDLQALQDAGRRTLRIHLGADAEAGLRTVLAAVRS